MNEKLMFCETCGKLISVFSQDQIPTSCCGQDMEEIHANTVDASLEKHVPVYNVDASNNTILVEVGEVLHPTEAEHHIMWIALVSGNTTTKVSLNPGDAPKAKFEYAKGSTIYAYCDIHGLWKKEVE